MNVVLPTGLEVTDSAVVSQTVEMEEEDNAPAFDFTIFNITGTDDLTVQLQGSTDLENWEDLGAGDTQGAIGSYAPASISVDCACARLRHQVVPGRRPRTMIDASFSRFKDRK